MARQNINIGTTPNDGTGDPLRTAFDKTNDNFIELYDDVDSNYTELVGLKNDITLNASNILQLDSELSSIDSVFVKNIIDSAYLAAAGTYSDSDVGVFLNGNLDGSIVPDTDSAYSLGDSSYRFKDLWLSGSTIHLGSKSLSVDSNGDMVEDQTLLFGEAYPETGVTHATWEDSSFDVRIERTTGASTIKTLQALKIDDKLILTSGFTGKVNTATIESRRDSADFNADYTHVIFGLDINNPEDSAGGNTQVYSFTAKKFPVKSLRQMPFSPADPTAWTSPAPVNLEDAMNRLAAYVKAQGGTA